MQNVEQRDRALATANRVRIRKAELKREIAADPTAGKLCDVIEGKHGAAGAALRVLEALTAMHRIGPTKARRIITASGAGLTFDARIGTLTDRQRAVLSTTVQLYVHDPQRVRDREQARRRRAAA